MKMLSRGMICGAALLGVALPASAAGVAQAHGLARVREISLMHGMGRVFPYPPWITRIPIYALTPGSGGGSGAFRLPPTGDGAATLQLFDESGAYVYVVRATLVRSPESPPDGVAEQGGFEGTLFATDIDGNEVPAAIVLGKWIRDVDGTGAYGVDILVHASDATHDHFLVSVGSIAGAMRAGLPSRGASGTDGLRARGASSLARLTATWIVQP
jgi:hypothetical protein